jgi:hypothetical protein
LLPSEESSASLDRASLVPPLACFDIRIPACRDFARNDESGLGNLHNVAALIYRPTEQNYDSAIGSRARRRDFNDLALDMQDVSRTGRCRPTHLAAGADEAASEWRATFDIQTHRDRGSVPTARRQTFEERALRGALVRMKGLWIELSRECLDLRFIKLVRSAYKALSDMKIVEIQSS